MNVRKVLQIPGGVRKAQKSVILPKNLEPKQTETHEQIPQGTLLVDVQYF